MDIKLLMFCRNYRCQFWLTVLIACLLLSQSCSLIETIDTQSATLIKSANDQRDYRRLTLSNNLDVLLISDPTTDKAAASLDVYMGSYQNPEDRQGLAHFLEHMLFLGTKQFPDPDEYQTFISEHGGRHNASTGLEHTNYFFDIDANHLESALDRFAPFFTHPNFDGAYVDRERNAVESEYRLKIKDDGRRQWDVLREQIDINHPLSKFTVGNLQTLADRDQSSIRDELIQMYQRYYSANLMTLVVLGKQSIEQLDAMVRSRFSAIVDRQISIKPYQHPYIQPAQLPMQITYTPLKQAREISLLFLLPNLGAHRESKPAHYLANLIGHEGQGSLLQALKAKGWVEALSAGIVLEDRGGSLFGIDLVVTSKGMAHRNQIIADLFAWINLIDEQGIEHWRHQELATMGDIEFRYSEKQDPSRYVASLSRNMHIYTGKELLRGPYQSTDFDRRAIQEIADRLIPRNMILMITDPEGTAETTSEYYQAPYTASAIDPLVIDRWTASDTNLQLRLPDNNPYIPQQLSLVRPHKAAQLPSIIHKQQGLRVWYLESSKFGVPKAQITVSLGTDSVASLQGITTAELYTAYITDQLNAELYPAMLAGLGYSISVDDRGILIELEGYAENQRLLINTILAMVLEPRWDKAVFETVRRRLIRHKINAKRDYPFRQIMAKLRSTLNGQGMPSDQVVVLETTTLEKLQQFTQHLIAGVDVEALISGNHNPQSADAISRELMALTRKNIALPTKVAKIPQADHSVNFPVDHRDSVVVQYIQGDEASLQERAKLSLIAHMISAPFFNQLRTEKQLGYVVSAFPLHANRVPGICMIVQSPVAKEPELRSEFGDFLHRFSIAVNELTEQDLDRHKEALLVNLLEPPKNLREMNARFAESLRLGFEDFQFRSQLAEAISALTVLEIRSAYDRMLLENPRRVWVQTSSSDPSLKKGSDSNWIKQHYSF
jgi:insulysin